MRWIRVDANVLETMPGKTEKKKIVLVRVDLATERETCTHTDRETQRQDRKSVV